MYPTYCALVHLNFFFTKVGHLLERVDGDEHRTNICLRRLPIKDHTRKTDNPQKTNNNKLTNIVPKSQKEFFTKRL